MEDKEQAELLSIFKKLERENLPREHQYQPLENLKDEEREDDIVENNLDLNTD